MKHPNRIFWLWSCCKSFYAISLHRILFAVITLENKTCWMSWIFWRGCTGKNNKRLKDANHGPWNSMIMIIFFFSSICNMLRARCCLACTTSTFTCGAYWCPKSNIHSIFHSRTASPILLLSYIEIHEDVV